MRVVFFGTPHFAAEVLNDLLANGVDVVAVVTKPDKPQGRSSELISTPVKLAAQSHTPPLPVLQPEMVSSPENTPLLEQYRADLFVVVAYGEIIKQHLLDMPKIGAINLHTSLLPKYRGAAPIQHAIIHGETETGVTIMHMAKKMDAGDIIATVKVAIGPDTTFGELEAALCKEGSALLLKVIKAFETGPAPSRTPQDHAMATLAPKIELENCKINWTMPAASIHNLIRGVNPYPGAWCNVHVKGQNKRLRIISSHPSTQAVDAPPCTLLPAPKGSLCVACGTGSLTVLEVQLEGKKAMKADEFMRGHPAGTLTFIQD